MKYVLREVSIRATREFEFIQISNAVRKCVVESGITNGVAFVITEHTTTGITINEGLPCVENDIMDILDGIAPADYSYSHDHYLSSYGTIGGNAPGHIKSLLTGNHCVLPVIEGEPVLGHAADIYFAEYDGIKDRHYLVYVMGE